MAFEVKIAPHALQQIDSALQYIAEELKSPTAAKNLLKKIYEEVTLIGLYPFSKTKVSWEKLSGKYRKFFVGNYVGVYTVNEEKSEVIILAFRYAPSGLGDRL